MSALALRARRRAPRPPGWWLLLLLAVCILAILIINAVTVLAALVDVAAHGVTDVNALFLIAGSLGLWAIGRDLTRGITIGRFDLTDLLYVLSAAAYYAAACLS